MDPSLHVDRAVLRFNWFHTTDHGHHTEITLHDVPNQEYTLRLFVENEERELQETGNQSWTPAQRLYALCFFATYAR